MRAEAVQELALRLIATELEGERTTGGYRNEVRRNVRQFFSWLTVNAIEDIRAVGNAELLSYYRHICSQKALTGTRKPGELLSRRTINGRLAAVRKVFASLYRIGYLSEDPLHGVSFGVPPERACKRRPFTEADMAAFLEQIDPSTPRGLRDRALFELIYSSGLRVSEAARLTIGDLDLERREIIVHGKGSCNRLVPISQVARDFLLQYAGARLARLDQPVFRESRARVAEKPMRSKEITRRFATLLTRFGMDGPGRSAHAVRHSTATHLLDHGASIRHVQELLGHKNIENTVRYTQVQTGGLAKLYRKYHPGEHELYEEVDEDYLKRLHGNQFSEKYLAQRRKEIAGD
jgi:site-specific recombinase XerD